jgi:hypothetical protein
MSGVTDPVNTVQVGYPWYDSPWLAAYTGAKAFVAARHPARLEDFVHAFDVLRTDPAFTVRKLPELFSLREHEELQAFVEGLSMGELERHEALRFGRTVVHDAPLCGRLHERMTERIGFEVGEAVEPTYTFVSLYNNLGVCQVHMDAPIAKWTVDYCIAQTAVWPIHFSQVCPWPEDFAHPGPDWEGAIKRDPANRFTAFAMQPRDAVVFAGSSQWHYRERIPRPQRENFCHLVFSHFTPRGAYALTRPSRWPALFGLPDLAEVIVVPEARDTTRLGAG